MAVKENEMALPDVSKERITQAFEVFNQEYRNTPVWADWEDNANYKYAVLHEGRTYPPKMVISLATGVPRNEFAAGHQSNSYLSRHGFKIIRLLDVGSHYRGTG